MIIFLKFEKHVRPELLGVTKVMYDFLARYESVHAVGDGTLTSSHLIPNILCRVLILIPAKSAGISRKASKTRVSLSILE